MECRKATQIGVVKARSYQGKVAFIDEVKHSVHELLANTTLAHVPCTFEINPDRGIDFDTRSGRYSFNFHSLDSILSFDDVLLFIQTQPQSDDACLFCNVFRLDSAKETHRLYLRLKQLLIKYQQQHMQSTDQTVLDTKWATPRHVQPSPSRHQSQRPPTSATSLHSVATTVTPRLQSQPQSRSSTLVPSQVHRIPLTPARLCTLQQGQQQQQQHPQVQQQQRQSHTPVQAWSSQPVVSPNIRLHEQGLLKHYGSIDPRYQQSHAKSPSFEASIGLSTSRVQRPQFKDPASQAIPWMHPSRTPQPQYHQAQQAQQHQKLPYEPRQERRQLHQRWWQGTFTSSFSGDKKAKTRPSSILDTKATSKKFTTADKHKPQEPQGLHQFEVAPKPNTVFVRDITAKDAKRLLQGCGSGTCLVRRSSTRPNLVFAFVHANHVIQAYIRQSIQEGQQVFFLDVPAAPTFTSLETLVAAYSSSATYRQAYCSSLSWYACNSHPKKIQFYCNYCVLVSLLSLSLCACVFFARFIRKNSVIRTELYFNFKHQPHPSATFCNNALSKMFCSTKYNVVLRPSEGL
eukprot:m.118625 g.118625  ORF g.118625 m.118625 type:complete len:572 (+) comp13657_c2_seq5:391-2106(+)